MTRSAPQWPRPWPHIPFQPSAEIRPWKKIPERTLAHVPSLHLLSDFVHVIDAAWITVSLQINTVAFQLSPQTSPIPLQLVPPQSRYCFSGSCYFLQPIVAYLLNKLGPSAKDSWTENFRVNPESKFAFNGYHSLATRVGGFSKLQNGRFQSDL